MTELREATEGKQEAAVSIEGKHPGMELLLEEPLVMATPVGLLAGHRITPNESLFVRNIQDPPGGHTLQGAVFWNPNGYE